MNNIKPKTIGELRELIKVLPDNAQMHIEDEDDSFDVMSIEIKPIEVQEEDGSTTFENFLILSYL